MFCRDFVLAGKRLQSGGRLFRRARSTKSLHGFARGQSNVKLQAPATSHLRLDSGNLNRSDRG